jgi:hypothetical protein
MKSLHRYLGVFILFSIISMSMTCEKECGKEQGTFLKIELEDRMDLNIVQKYDNYYYHSRDTNFSNYNCHLNVTYDIKGTSEFPLCKKLLLQDTFIKIEVYDLLGWNSSISSNTDISSKFQMDFPYTLGKVYIPLFIEKYQFLSYDAKRDYPINLYFNFIDNPRIGAHQIIVKTTTNNKQYIDTTQMFYIK